jgi:branched-chain amino acid transport system permease protein
MKPFPSRSFTVASVACLVALAVVPVWVRRADVLNLGVLVCLAVVLAESWNILGGVAGQINLGHAAFFGLGALSVRSLWLRGVPIPFALLAGGTAAAAGSLLIGYPAFRLRGAYFAIGTLALAEILRITVGNLLPNVSALPTGHVATYSLAGRYYLAFGLAVLSVAVAAGLARSRIGLGMRAVREDEAAAAAAGVNALRVKLVALALSTFLAGLAGGAFAYYHASYYPQLAFSPHWTFDALLMTFIGGVGTAGGPVVGAIFYVVLKEVLAVRLVELHLLIFGALFIGVVLLMPGGLVEGLARARRALARRAPSLPFPR